MDAQYILIPFYFLNTGTPRGKIKPTLKRHLGREHDWEGGAELLGRTVLPEKGGAPGWESPIHLQDCCPGQTDPENPSLSQGTLSRVMNPSGGFQNTEVCAYPQAFLVQEAGMGPGDLHYSQVPKGHWCCWLGDWDTESPSHNSEILCRLSLDFP